MNYKSYWKKEEYVLKEAVIHVTIISAIILALTYFGRNFEMVGAILILAGLLPLISLKLTGEKIKESISEIVFGFVNTSLITLMAILGYDLGGLLGAIMGVALGDAITEGYSGILEGEVSDLLLKWKIKEKIDPLNSSLGKMAGALLGGGLVLLIYSLL